MRSAALARPIADLPALPRALPHIARPDGREGHRRETLRGGPLGLVERTEVSPRIPACGYEANHQIVLSFAGLFEYRVGTKGVLIDPNRILFVSPDREFHDVHPVKDVGHRSVIITPAREALEEVCGGTGAASHPAFAHSSRPSSGRLKLLTHELLHPSSADEDSLRYDELTITAMREALDRKFGNGHRRSRVVNRAKELLHARAFEPVRLGDIAAEVGVTPIYLTQEFSRSEGMPLYRYQMWLRLNKALAELRRCDDITGLALDLGFSSHSHFTSVFRKAFGMTPSQYRSSCR